MSELITGQSLDTVRGTLPDLFLQADGSRWNNPAAWSAHRQALLSTAAGIGFGGMPPQPDSFSCTCTYEDQGGGKRSYLITAGTREKTVSMEMRVFSPAGPGPFPVLLTGDGCWRYFEGEMIDACVRRGFLVAIFNRTVLAHDRNSYARRGGIYDLWPELDFGAISAWAWGYQRCVDALEQIPIADCSRIAITGHSRGGKTTLLAGAADQRIRYTQCNCSGLFGTGCLRYDQVRDPQEHYAHSERLANLFGFDVDYPGFGYWVNAGMADYIGREEQIPFDMHFLKAAIAPRYLFESNSVDDVWANPKGAWHTHHAAKELFRFLGAEDHICSRYRTGCHQHSLEDVMDFLDFIEDMEAGKPCRHENADRTYRMPSLRTWEAPAQIKGDN